MSDGGMSLRLCGACADAKSKKEKGEGTLIPHQSSSSSSAPSAQSPSSVVIKVSVEGQRSSCPCPQSGPHIELQCLSVRFCTPTQSVDPLRDVGQGCQGAAISEHKGQRGVQPSPSSGLRNLSQRCFEKFANVFFWYFEILKYFNFLFFI